MKLTADDREIIVLGVLTIFIIIVAIFTGCAHMPPPTPLNVVVMPVNFECFVHENSDGTGRCLANRGGQATKEQLVAMDAAYVVKLNLATLEGHDQLPPGVEMYDHPWSGVGPVGHDDTLAALFDLERAIEAVRAAGHGVVYTHCSHGSDRTGRMATVPARDNRQDVAVRRLHA